MGVQPGVPDILIFSPPPLQPWARGVALELKRDKGGKNSVSQDPWLNNLEHAGWLAAAGYGSNEAIDWLEKLGFIHESRYPSQPTFESDDRETETSLLISAIDRIA